MENPLRAVEIAADVFAFVGVVGPEAAVLPLHVKLFERIGGDLVVGGVRGLLLGREDGRTGDGAAAAGKNALRILFSGDPEDLIEPVNAPIAEGAIGVVEVVAETAGMDAAVAGADGRGARITAIVRAERSGAAPHVPVELLRDGDGG